MRPFGPAASLGLALILSPALQASSQSRDAAYAPAPVPTAIRNAHKLFLANGGADVGLFPHPFSGDPNRGYDELYALLRKTGAYELVSDPAQADVVLEIELVPPLGPKVPNKEDGSPDPDPMFRLKIFDTRSHFRIWTITELVKPAFKQQTHDRNFDEGLSRVVSDFVAAARSAPAGK